MDGRAGRLRQQGRLRLISAVLVRHPDFYGLLRCHGRGFVIADTAGKRSCAEHVTAMGGADDGGVRRAWRNAGLAALLLLGCATAGAYRLAGPLPAELPDAATIAGWERYAGQARMGDSTVVYELYVNPVRPALYEITRYRVTATALDTDGRRRRHEETEKVLWNPATVPRQPLRCFEWVTNRSWKKLWLGASGEWRRIEPSTAAYKSQMETAIQVYNLHNRQQVY